MRQALEAITTFDEFVDFLQSQPENLHYELYNGEIVQMPQPKGKHEKIVAFLVKLLMSECIKLKLEYGIPSKTLVKPENKKSGYFPDILVLNLPNLVNEPRWEDESIVNKPESIPLVIEVVSTNWRDDYLRKSADYEEMGIREYWIIDYYPFGSELMIDKGKQATVSIYCLNDQGNYQRKQFRENERIESPTFSELNITAQEIFAAQINC